MVQEAEAAEACPHEVTAACQADDRAEVQVADQVEVQEVADQTLKNKKFRQFRDCSGDLPTDRLHLPLLRRRGGMGDCMLQWISHGPHVSPHLANPGDDYSLAAMA